MRLTPIIAAAALGFGTQALSTDPPGLSLQEAQALPAPLLSERVLGALGALYSEVERPSRAITRGRAFVVKFASTPRSAGYPGLCEADTITVSFGPPADSPATAIAHVQSAYHGRVYRIVGDTSPQAGGWNDSYSRMLAAQCTAAGPVLSHPGMARRFFAASYYAGGNWAARAYFGARALAMASSSASPPARCRDDSARPGDNVCADPAALLRNPPMERFLGFRIDRCEAGVPDLCVTAHFSRGPRPDSRGIDIRMRTSLTESLYPPSEFALREIRIRAFTLIP